ncbi:MAG: FHA domain-containing protein [Thermoguttaceae bacterium]
MSETATSPRRTSRWKSRQRLAWPVAIACGLSAAAWVFESWFVLPSLAVSVAVLAGILRYRSVRMAPPRRLVPMGLDGNLAVRLKGTSLMVGRLPCCGVEIPLPTVSSHHCRLVRKGARWYIEDLDSRNGTFVNGKQVDRKRLRVGDWVGIGELEFVVE